MWTILLVDDEDDVRSVMKSMLRQRGYNVLDASSGADAIRLLADHTGPVDMLVTDVLMPGMSGRELYEHLSRRQPGLKVLFVSGYSDDTFGREPGWGTTFLSEAVYAGDARTESARRADTPITPERARHRADV